LEETPFPVAVTKYQLINNILSFESKPYLDAVEVFLEDKGCVEDGNASKRVVEKILEMMEAQS